MKIAIIDDDPAVLDQLQVMLEDFSLRHQYPMELSPFPGGEAFLAALERERFSLVLMDIYMEGTDGLTAASRLREMDVSCLLVFLTVSGDHMPDAFSRHAFDYIQKPVLPERLEDLLLDALALLSPVPDHIEVASGRRTERLFLSDIVSAVTDAHYVDIVLSGGGLVRSRMTIQEFLDLTAGDPRFVTVNKGIVLNADRVAGFENSCYVMDSGARFPVRVRERVRVEQAVRDYHFAKLRRQQRQKGGPAT